MPCLIQDRQASFERQATLEGMLNADTRDQLAVSVPGQADFVFSRLGQLLFLELKKDDRQLHFLR